DRPYPCMYCPKRFATNSNLRQHIRTHTGERPHVCVYPGCGRGFNDATKLTNHQRIHTGERPFVCAICGHECATRNNLKSHMRSHYDPKSTVQRQKEQERRAEIRAEAEADLFKRKGHGRGPMYLRDESIHVKIRLHAQRAAQTAQDSNIDGSRRCFCDSGFSQEMNEDLRKDTEDAEIIAESAINAQVRNQSDGTEAWEVDGASAVSLSLIPAICLQQYVCNICNKVYSNSSNLAQHKRTIHPKDYVRRYLCTFCNKTFSLITNLRRHQKRTCPNVKHEPGTESPESWPCEECGKVCSTKGNLKSHKVTHLGIKLFECFICEKRFTTNSNLKQHLIVHDGKYNGHQAKRKRGTTSIATASSDETRVQHRTNSNFKQHLIVHDGKYNGYQGKRKRGTTSVATVSSDESRVQGRTDTSVATSKSPQSAATNTTTSPGDTTTMNSNETMTAVKQLQEVEANSFVTGDTSVAEEHIVVITEKDMDHNETELAPTLADSMVSTADIDGVRTVASTNEAQQQQQSQVQQQQITTSTIAVRNSTVSGDSVLLSEAKSVTFTPSVTRLTQRPMIIKLDVDRDTKPSTAVANTNPMACGAMAEGPTARPVLLPPPPPKGSSGPTCYFFWSPQQK
ncbi:zinc finger protein-like, partial [Tropilaelaps mercedesae]